MSLAVGAVFRPLGAQNTPRGLPPDFTSDSVAWQRVLVYVVGALSTQIVRAAADPSPQPWHLRLPPDEPQRRLLETQLETIIRARPVTDNDSVVFTLEIGALRVDNDTAHVRVRSGVAHRCAGAAQVAGWDNLEDVLVPRTSQGFWGAARSVGVMHGDRPLCPRPAR